MTFRKPSKCHNDKNACRMSVQPVKTFLSITTTTKKSLAFKRFKWSEKKKLFVSSMIHGSSEMLLNYIIVPLDVKSITSKQGSIVNLAIQP